MLEAAAQSGLNGFGLESLAGDVVELAVKAGANRAASAGSNPPAPTEPFQPG
jgi:hypothetical protein